MNFDNSSQNYPKWCQIAPNYHKTAISEDPIDFSRHNTRFGKVYLRSLNLSPSIWSADRIAFYRRNIQQGYSVQIFEISPKGEIAVQIHWSNCILSIRPGGQVANGKHYYDRLVDLNNRKVVKNGLENRFPPVYPTFSSLLEIREMKVNFPEITHYHLMPQKNFRSTLIYAFDFDGTLVEGHLTGRPKLSDSNLQSTVFTSGFLRWLFRFLIQSNKKIYIVTFSDKNSFDKNSDVYKGEEMVNETLSTIFDPNNSEDQKIFQQVRVIAYFPENYGLANTKNEHLAIACRENKCSPKQCCLIDDNLSNCQMAKQAGYSTVHVPNGIPDLFLS